MQKVIIKNDEANLRKFVDSRSEDIFLGGVFTSHSTNSFEKNSGYLRLSRFLVSKTW